jgi:hypothetical protein
MKQRDGLSGQIMLTGAFILAITLVSIALILNNVVYFNNVSYMGFMDNSGNSDISIKNLVAQEAINAYDEFHDNEDAFNRTMLDLANSLNNVTLSEGTKVVISPPYFFNTSYDTTLTYPSTKFNLTIYTKDSTKTYSISTSYSPPPPTPTPGPIPLKCKVTISSPGNNSIVFPGNHTYVTITVINSSNPSIPVINQIVTVNNNILIGKLCKNEDGTSLVDYVTNPAITDNNGNIQLYWFPNIIEGTDVINASIGYKPSLADQNLSNNVMIINKIFRTCSHTVNIDNAQLDTSHNGNDYSIDIQVPITVPEGSNFSYFSVGSFLNSSASNNVKFLSYSDMGNVTVPGYVTGHLTAPYDKATIRFGWPNATGQNKQFTAVFTVTVSAYCNLDNGYYLSTRVFTVTGPP